MTATHAAARPTRFQPIQILLVGFWFALCTALGEIALRGVQSHVLHRKIWLSIHYVWMIPLALSVLFLCVAFLLVVVGQVVRPLRKAGPVIGIFTFLVLIGPVLTVGRLHAWALLLLTAGVSTIAAQILAARSHWILPVVRRTLPFLLLVVAIGPAVTLVTVSLRERRALAALAAPPDNAPNVIFIILDTVRAEELELYGYGLETMPNLARFARDGTTFTSAWSVSPWTLPSHASMFTGHYDHDLSTDLLTPLDGTYETIAEHFHSRGYMTAGFAANLLFTTPESGLSRGFVHYESYPVSPSMVAYSSLATRRIVDFSRHIAGSRQMLVRRPAAQVVDAFLDWQAGIDRRPFFAFINLFDAHAPYLPPDSLNGKFGARRRGRAMADLSVKRDWTNDEMAAERAAYDAVLSYLDGELGRLFDAIDHRGLDQAIVILAGDHGEHLGEHGGLTDHGNSLYSPLLHVPLVIHGAGRVPAGVRVTMPVSLRDITATIVDLAGQTPSPFPGVSLAPLTRGQPVNPSPVLSEVREGIRTPPWLPLARGPMASLVDSAFHYIRNGDGVEELYRLSDDPGELHDLAAEPARASTLVALRRRLDELREDRPPHAAVAATGARAPVP